MVLIRYTGYQTVTTCNESTKVHNPRGNPSTGKYTEIWPTSSEVACYPLMLKRGIVLFVVCTQKMAEQICIRGFMHSAHNEKAIPLNMNFFCACSYV